MSLSFFELHHPWLLLLLLPGLGAVAWRHRRRGGTAAIVFPTVVRLKGLRPTLRQRLRFVIPLLETLAVTGLVVAAARPRQGKDTTVVRSEGIAIQMVLDRSSSMEETMSYEGKERKRIDIVKEVFERFIAGGDGLSGRKTDLIGLTTFARFTEESCPLIVPHDPLRTAVKNLRTVEPAVDRFGQPVAYADLRRYPNGAGLAANPLNATAIGDGLHRAALSLITAEEDLRAGEEAGAYKIKGKVAIVLTDGENNAGEIDPVEAGKTAAANGIKVYFVVFSETTVYRQNFFGGREVVGERSEDDMLAVPREVVEPGGGRAYLARTGDELRDIYAEIDKLERSDVGKIEYRSYAEKFHLALLPAIACALLAIFLGETLFRGVP